MPRKWRRILARCVSSKGRRVSTTSTCRSTQIISVETCNSRSKLVNIRFSNYHILKPSRRPQKSNKINNFALASRFFVPFFAVAARFSYTTRMCRISRRGKTQDNDFLFLSFFFPLTSMQTLGFNP